jgi:hypothetical protein
LKRLSVFCVPVLCSMSWSVLAATPAASTLAPPIRVETRLKAGAVQLGEPFTVEVLVTHQKTQRYELSKPADSEDFDFRGVERRRVDSGEASTTSFEVSLAAFRLGKLKTPALTLTVSDQQESTMEVAGTDVEVKSSLPPEAQKEGADLFDVRAPEALWVRTYRLIYILLGLLSALAVAYALYRFVTRQRAPTPAVVKPLLPLHIRTEQALDALQKEALPKSQRGREFYFRLSEILRGYLGERYGFEALESTTPELLSALKKRPTPGLAFDELASFAHASDFVRYAKNDPLETDCDGALALAYRIVVQTTQGANAAAQAQPPAAAAGRSS